MKIRSLIVTLVGISVMGLAGCGGGGGGGATTAVVSGTAAKGTVRNAKVQVFSITAPNTFALLKEGTTNTNGNYSLDIGSHTGPVKVEVSGGEFKDETTGAFTPMLFTMRAVVGKVAIGGNNVSVTGLTEIAVKRIEGSTNRFDEASIEEANRTVGTFFGVTNITGVTPADATVAGSSGDSSYGLALASLMQFSNRPGVGVTNAFDDFGKLLNGKLDPDNQTNQRMTEAVLSNFLADRNTFLASARNLSGVTGKTTATIAELRLKTEGTLPAGTKINALELTISMPQGVTVTAAQDGSVDTSSATAPVKLSGVAALSGATLVAGGTKFTAATASTPNKLKLVIVFTTGSGFDIGEFVTVTCKIDPNTVVTGSHFIISGFKAVTVGTDTSSIGSRLEGISPAASVAFR